MADIFISHVEEDSSAARQIGDALEVAGYSTWNYEKDSIPGPSYLLQTAAAIERSKAVVVVISPDSLGSHQVTKEVIHGHESAKPFVPVLISVSHVEFTNRQPEWREAIGAAASIAVPRSGVAGILPRIVEGVEALGIEPSGGNGAHAGAMPLFLPHEPRHPLRRLNALRPWQKLAAVALLLAVVAAGTTTLVASRDNGPAAPKGSRVFKPPGANFLPGPAVDAATTPLETSQGQARISEARLATEYCGPSGGACKKPSMNLYLILTLEGWTGGGLHVFIIPDEDSQSYVVVDGQRLNALGIGDETSGVLHIVYGGIPASASGRDIELYWPDNRTFTIHVTGP